MTRRFAEDTSVPVGRSQDEVKVRLRGAGANQIAVFESDERTAVAFTLGDRMYRLTVPITPAAKDRRQDERRAWRLLLLLLKAKMEAVREGATTVEREFLADMLLPDGSTVYERAQDELRLAYAGGSMPDRLLLEGPSR
jgi:hypothetical protein